MRSETHSHHPEVAVARIAASQYGLVTRHQALGDGVSASLIKRRVRSGAWVRVHPGVYRLTGHPVSWRQSLLAVCFAAGNGSLISHDTGAALHGLDGFDEALTPEFTVPRGTRVRIPGAILHRARSLPDTDRTSVDGIPVTSVARTLIDIAATSETDRVELALDSALRRRLATRRWLEWRLEEGRGSLNGSAVLRRLLKARDEMSAAVESRLESLLLRVLRDGRIPGLVAQYEVFARGRLVARLDFAIPSAKIAIEADGYAWHEGRRPWRQDRTRQTELASLGWVVLTFTWEDLGERAHVIERVRAALAHRLTTVGPGSSHDAGGGTP